MKSFSHRLEQAILKAGVTKGALAHAVGVPASSVSRWLTGSIPRVETLSEIAKFLGVEVKDLIQDEKSDEAVIREDPTLYRAELKVPLRPPGQPTLMERIERLDEHREETKRTMEEINAKLDSLLDFFKGGRS